MQVPLLPKAVDETEVNFPAVASTSVCSQDALQEASSSSSNWVQPITSCVSRKSFETGKNDI